MLMSSIDLKLFLYINILTYMRSTYSEYKIIYRIIKTFIFPYYQKTPRIVSYIHSNISQYFQRMISKSLKLETHTYFYFVIFKILIISEISDYINIYFHESVNTHRVETVFQRCRRIISQYNITDASVSLYRFM